MNKSFRELQVANGPNIGSCSKLSPPYDNWGQAFEVFFFISDKSQSYLRSPFSPGFQRTRTAVSKTPDCLRIKVNMIRGTRGRNPPSIFSVSTLDPIRRMPLSLSIARSPPADVHCMSLEIVDVGQKILYISISSHLQPRTGVCVCARPISLGHHAHLSRLDRRGSIRSYRVTCALTSRSDEVVRYPAELEALCEEGCPSAEAEAETTDERVCKPPKQF